MHMHNTKMYMWVKSEVSTANISGVAHINLEKRDPVWLPNNQYLRYYPNYLHAYVQYILAPVHNISIINISEISYINVATR